VGSQVSADRELAMAQKPHGKLRVLIDDEPLARSNLRSLLQRDAGVEIIGECGFGFEALVAIRRDRPDLVFLDVQMPECDGFDVLEMLGSELLPAVIFVTAYDQYALRAFEAGALDYLLKPFDNTRFEKALGRARERIAGRSDAPRKLEQFAIKSAGKVEFVKIREIDWIEAADYYSCLHVGSRSHLLRRSLNDLERELDPAVFCRVHRSAIVRLERVRGLETGESGEYEVVLQGGTRVHLSRRYKKRVQERLQP
jgi:two-component system LytT family response regulator